MQWSTDLVVEEDVQDPQVLRLLDVRYLQCDAIDDKWSTQLDSLNEK
jgi:hypothetical protein